jgi:hypothetical protein
MQRDGHRLSVGARRTPLDFARNRPPAGPESRGGQAPDANPPIVLLPAAQPAQTGRLDRMFDYSCKVGNEKLTATVTYEFSKVGKPIAIKPPPGFR